MKLGMVGLPNVGKSTESIADIIEENSLAIDGDVLNIDDEEELNIDSKK